jgi:hypothetical protein
VTTGASQPTTSAEQKALAEAWFQRWVTKLEAHHGARWPDVETFVLGYLRQELRMRLLATGWRPKAC